MYNMGETREDSDVNAKKLIHLAYGTNMLKNGYCRTKEPNEIDGGSESEEEKE